MKELHSRPGAKEKRGAAISRVHNTLDGRRKLANRRRKGESVETWKKRIGQVP